jgi:hypothetical protein
MKRAININMKLRDNNKIIPDIIMNKLLIIRKFLLPMEFLYKASKRLNVTLPNTMKNMPKVT